MRNRDILLQMAEIVAMLYEKSRTPDMLVSHLGEVSNTDLAKIAYAAHFNIHFMYALKADILCEAERRGIADDEVADPYELFGLVQ